MSQPTTERPAVKYANWLDPLNKIIWQAVFKARGTEMKLRDGRVFTIKYTPDGKTWVSPKYRDSGLVPCGWFVVSEVTGAGWNRGD